MYIEMTELGVSRAEFAVPGGTVSGKPDAIASNAMDAYFDHACSALDEVSLDLSFLSPWCRNVLQLVSLIPVGVSMTYGEIADKLGKPNSSRAVGQAVAANPVLLFIPCHRVLAANQMLGGYSGGLANKRWLLAHEGIAYQE